MFLFYFVYYTLSIKYIAYHRVWLLQTQETKWKLAEKSKQNNICQGRRNKSFATTYPFWQTLPRNYSWLPTSIWHMVVVFPWTGSSVKYFLQSGLHWCQIYKKSGLLFSVALNSLRQSIVLWNLTNVIVSRKRLSLFFSYLRGKNLDPNSEEYEPVSMLKYFCHCYNRYTDLHFLVTRGQHWSLSGQRYRMSSP